MSRIIRALLASEKLFWAAMALFILWLCLDTPIPGK